MKPRHRARRHARGSLLVLHAFSLVLVLGFAGLVLDLGLVYFRKAQLQTAADAIALAAAQKLNGTVAGVAAAASAAASNATTHRVGISTFLEWPAAADALQFNSSPEAAGDWKSAPEAGADAATAARMWYARVDLGLLDAGQRRVRPVFMGVLGAGNDIDVAAVAVAGQASLKVTPLALCAMSPVASATRDYSSTLREIVSYGFRTGVTYNLLHLNPAPNATSGGWFLVDPLIPPGTTAAADTGSHAALAPFMCSGTLAYGGIGTSAAAGGNALPVNLHRPATFTLAAQLNSRFGTYGGTAACAPNGAPADTNIFDYRATANWHPDGTPPTVTAKPSSGPGLPLRTVADLALPAPAIPNGDYGVRWAFAQPRSGSTAIDATKWNTLYPASPAVQNPATWRATPYTETTTANNRLLVPPATTPSRAERRVLTVPLLDCTAFMAGGGVAPALASAPVLAFGRFLLSAPATATEVPGEFGGVLTPTQLDRLRTVEIFR